MSNYGESEKKSEVLRGSQYPVSTQNKLDLRKKELEKELKAINEAITLFKDHPEIPDALDLLSQIRL